MSRYKPVGWRNDSHRHYLAAKGISTRGTKYLAAKGVGSKYDHKRYMVDADRLAAGLKKFFDDGRPETEDFAGQMKMQTVDNLRNEVVGKLQDAEKSGDMSFENAQRFMNDDFTHETKDFLNNTIDKKTYEDNVNRKLGHHSRVHGSTVRMFG